MMTIYARVIDGVVAEIFVPPPGADLDQCFHPDVMAQFIAAPEDVSPTQGWRYAAGVFSAPPPAPAPTLAQQAQAMLIAGIQIVSTGTSALKGTYAVDPTTYQRISGIVAAIAGGLGLPGGDTTFNWPDTSGTPHAFSAANFTDFARAVMNFEYVLNTIVGSNCGTLPVQPVTIA